MLLSKQSLVKSKPTSFELIPTSPNDRYFDYCLEPYKPRTRTAGKLRSENILWASLEHAGLLDMRPMLEAIQESLGRDMTVWGVKHAAGKVWLELYFYDSRKEDTQATVSGLTEILAPWLRVVPGVPEWVKYMMVSIDLREDTLERGTIDEFNLYLTGTNEHQGRSYKVTKERTELDNTYRFLPPKAEVDMLLSLTQSSMFVDFSEDPRVLSKVIMPKLFACKRACVAKKRSSDGIYHSGIDVEQLLWFLRKFNYPAAITEFISAHHDRLDHLYYDVGLDYRQDPADKSIVYPKSSFYGTL